MKLIPLTMGQFAMVDDSDFDLIMRWKWRAEWKIHTFYAVRSSEVGGHKRNMRMHRLILGLDDYSTPEIDHIDRNGLNNQIHNLRPATPSQQRGNIRMLVNNTSGFRGVTYNKLRRYWHAQITVNDQHVHLGSFSDKIKAAQAYNIAAIHHFGEFAQLNPV